LERVVLRAIMDISARAVLLPDRPRMGHLGHKCSHAQRGVKVIARHPGRYFFMLIV